MKKFIALCAGLLLCLGVTVTTFAADCNHDKDAEDTTLVHFEAVEATEEAHGNIEYWKCTVCAGYFAGKYGEDEVAGLETVIHYEVKDEDVEATCTEAGSKGGSHCSICKEVITEAEVIEPLGHDWDEGTVIKEATKTENGKIQYTCTREGCGATKTEVIEKEEDHEHVFVNGICSICGYVKESVVQREDGNWYYVVDDEIQSDYTGIKPNQWGWWRIVDGMVDFSCYSVCENEWGWWYIEGGQVNFDYTGIKPNELGWWRIVDGMVDFSCWGVYGNEYGWFYLEGGKVNFDYTGIKPNENGWWRIVGGEVDFGFTGLASNENGWFYLECGHVNFDYTGLQPYEGTWWMVENGCVNFHATTVVYNDGNWWYVRDGAVQFSYTGFGYNDYGWWYIKDGKVDFSKNGRVYGTINGSTQYWYVAGGHVTGGSATDYMTEAANLYTSPTEWLIMVDCTSNFVGIFRGEDGNRTLYAKWACSTGAAGTETPKGVFAINDNRGYSFSGPDDAFPNLSYDNPNHYTCYYYTGFLEGGYLFHSTLYRYNSFVVLNDTLGADLSHGCVRLAIENAKWIYENIPTGTTVVTY